MINCFLVFGMSGLFMGYDGMNIKKWNASGIRFIGLGKSFLCSLK